MTSRLPNFLIIGAAKAGTTALCDYLLQHPDVFMSHPKEPHFFAFEGQQLDFRGPRDDLRLNRVAVPDRRRYERLFNGANGHAAVGEASTSYLYTPGTAERIRKTTPGARLICLLRDPVRRAFSAFMYMRTQLREPLDDLADALEAEPDRIQKQWQHIWHYRNMGFYAAQLRSYLDVFPREQLKVIVFDEFQANPRQVIAESLEFLSLDPTFQPRYTPASNRSGVVKSKLIQKIIQTNTPLHDMARRMLPKGLKQRILNANLKPAAIAPAIARQLATDYRDDVGELSELLGRDLTGWTRTWLADR